LPLYAGNEDGSSCAPGNAARRFMSHFMLHMRKMFPGDAFVRALAGKWFMAYNCCRLIIPAVLRNDFNPFAD